MASKQTPAAKLVTFGGEVYVIVSDVSNYIKTSAFISGNLKDHEFAVSLNTGKLVFYRTTKGDVVTPITVDLFVNGIFHEHILSLDQAECVITKLCELNLLLSISINGGGLQILDTTTPKRAIASFHKLINK